ncbi:MAG: hypothetical protein PHF37_03135 [Phycisphaerae bacterium]|jgi:hypothetical protein|nr:hypothetical protein [Phycisphaerae bacterium]
MEADIHVVSWQVAERSRQKIIIGNYEVRVGGVVAAKTSFNDGYDSIEVQIPNALMAKIEAIDAEVRQAVIDNFAK